MMGLAVYNKAEGIVYRGRRDMMSSREINQLLNYTTLFNAISFKQRIAKGIAELILRDEEMSAAEAMSEAKTRAYLLMSLNYRKFEATL